MVVFRTNNSEDDICIIVNEVTGEVMKLGVENEEGLYEIVVQFIPKTSFFLSKSMESKLLWHERLGNISKKGIREARKAVEGAKDMKASALDFYEPGPIGESSRAPRASSGATKQYVRTYPLDEVCQE